MIYLVCPICGYSIDIMADEEVNNIVRAKRLKYLTTRDQVCPNCVNTIGKCEKIEAKESEIPVIRVVLDENQRSYFTDYCRKNGYAVGTGYALDQYLKVKA
jgi:hypothetical protein